MLTRMSLSNMFMWILPDFSNLPTLSCRIPALLGFHLHPVPPHHRNTDGHIHTYTHTHGQTHTHPDTDTHMSTHIDPHTYTCTDAHRCTQTHTRLHTWTHMDTHTYTQAHTCAHLRFLPFLIGWHHLTKMSSPCLLFTLSHEEQ